MKRSVLYVLPLLLLSAGVARGADPEVTNVQANQVPGTRQVQVSYDVSWTDGDTLDINVVVSSDAGSTFNIVPITVSGSIGRIVAGTGKSILWEAGEDLGEVVGNQYQAKVSAIGVTPWTWDLPGGVTMEFVPIPRGTFTMGSPDTEPGRNDQEGPQHEVTITQGFYFGKHEVTQGQWQAVMGTTPWLGQQFAVDNPAHPAAYVSWDDAQAFIQALNTAAGDSLYRLPTEAEWEYACRAGTTTRWSFGDDENLLGDYAWYLDNTGAEFYPHAVGTKLPNPWGLHDVHGNVNEWCADLFGPYSSDPQVDPTGPVSGTNRVLKGGSFGFFAKDTRSAIHGSNVPTFSADLVGFRVLRRIQ